MYKAEAVQGEKRKSYLPIDMVVIARYVVDIFEALAASQDVSRDSTVVPVVPVPVIEEREELRVARTIDVITEDDAPHERSNTRSRGAIVHSVNEPGEMVGSRTSELQEWLDRGSGRCRGSHDKCCSFLGGETRS
jgi:hypothetical protein